MNVYFFISFRVRLLILIAIALQAHAQDSTPSLKSYNFKSASVLPITYIMHDGKPVKYVILGQEANPRKNGEYDDFGGRRDDSDEHPVQTAAREFYEEAIVPATLGWDLEQTEKYLDLKSKHTFLILAVAKRVMYMTAFSPEDIATLKYMFHKARQEQTLPIFKEKKNIASIRWDDLEDAIKNAQSNKGVHVHAHVIDSQTGKTRKAHSTITLRPLLVKRLRPFFLGREYQEGKKPNIRFYS